MPFEQSHLLRFGPIFSFRQASDVPRLASHVAALRALTIRLTNFIAFQTLLWHGLMVWGGTLEVWQVLWTKLSGDSHRSFHCWCLLAVIPEQIWRGDCSASLAAKERQVMLCRTILSWRNSLKRVGFLESQSKCRVWHQEHREIVSTHFWRFSVWSFNMLTVLYIDVCFSA